MTFEHPIPAPPTGQRVPKPLSNKQKARVEHMKQEKLEANRAAVAPKLEGLLDTFGPKHEPKVKEKKEVHFFDPFAPRIEHPAEVDWSKNDQDTNMRTSGGKHKNPSGEKKGK